jgi:hypothetical protein
MPTPQRVNRDQRAFTSGGLLDLKDQTFALTTAVTPLESNFTFKQILKSHFSLKLRSDFWCHAQRGMAEI